MDDLFYVPQSRFSLVEEEKLKAINKLKLLAGSLETGVSLAKTSDNRFIFNFGHLEYDKDTLHKEYIRDLKKNLDINKPVNYYWGKADSDNIIMNWRATASIFFNNWLNYAVYQATPFDIENIKAKTISKFGGSSLSDSTQFKKVKNIIASDEDRNIIVVSAPSKRDKEDIKVTDLLINVSDCQAELEDIKVIIKYLTEKQSTINNKLDNNLNLIQDRFYEIVKNLNLDNSLKTEIVATINEIKDNRSRDFILSRGEYLNAKLMAAFLNYKFIDAKELIYFSNGTIDLEKTYKKIKEAIDPKEKFVIPGFYGNENGNIKIFNRGGSDYTGSILAPALETNVYENWTDVNGIMSADPNVDTNAKKYEYLSYKELKTIIEAGASVYQQEAIEPLIDKNITLRILNTNKPDEIGTLIKD